MVLLGLDCENLMECQNKVLKKITKSNSNFTSNFVNHYLLGDVNFNEHCLIKNNISVPKK